MISIQQIQYILALAEELHFVKASERCFVTQPTLSMQVKKAEEILGKPVFDRSVTPMKLTDFGTSIIPFLRNTIVEYDRIEEFVRKQEGTYKEIIRIGVIPTIASYMIIDMYEQWRSQMEGQQVIIQEFTTEDLLVEMEKGNVDVGILAGPVHHPSWRTTPLFVEEIKAFIPESEKVEVSTEDLEAVHPWLLTAGNCLRTQMVHFCGLANEVNESHWDYQGGNIDLLVEMVRMNGGYTLVPVNHDRSLLPQLKTIRSASGDRPAREIIAISNKRSLKWDSIESLIRSIQLKYASAEPDGLTVLSWK